LWSPDDPHLYDLQVRLLKGSKVVDTIDSYFGMRKIEIRRDDTGRPRIFLNDRYTFNLGVADQGFWPDGLYTPASDAALKFDLQAIKALGFNTVRKHIKIEPQRWYTYCDRMGLLVWQDMPTGNNDSPEARAEYEEEMKENLRQLHNHPSITTWVLFNEGWGAYDQDRLARWMKQADPSRLLNGHSGPFNQVEFAQILKRLTPRRVLDLLNGGAGLLDEIQMTQFTKKWNAGDLSDVHYYPGPQLPPPQEGAASVTGEHGSFGVYIEGHVWNELQPVGRGVGVSGLTPQAMLKAYDDSIEQLKSLETRGLSGSNYFEIFDVEGEQQGLITYDREVAKVPVEDIARLNSRLVPQAKNYAAATRGFSVGLADPTPESQRYAALVKEYQNGKRDVQFLRRLTLMALRQNDQAQATAAGNEFIARSQPPYSKEFWQAVTAITRTSSDKGFELLRTRMQAANEVLGAQAAEKKILEVITREEIAPAVKDKQRAPDWAALEKAVTAKYDALGREAVYAAQMMEYGAREEWDNFGRLYALYYASALPRSLYPVPTLSYQVLEHVSDAGVLDTAIRVMKGHLDAEKDDSTWGRYSPVDLDLYANLLYKAGRRPEALEWQQKAVQLSDARDPEINLHLEKMKAGAPTWAGAITLAR
jgi:hypothetical protein